MKETSKHVVLGRHTNLLGRKDLISIKHDRTQSSFTTQLPAYCIPKAIMMGPKIQLSRTERPGLSEQQFGSSVQAIENVSNLTAKAPIKKQGDLSSSCVPVSVKS